MELKSLCFGLAFTMGVFAVKSGAGIAYLLGRRVGWRNRLGIISIFSVGYGLVFLLVWLVAGRMRILDHLQTLMHLFQGGMIMHCLFTVLLCIWGIILLAGRRRNNESRGWLMLVAPCPVCLSVFFCCAVLLENVLHDFPYVMFLLYCGFVVTSCLTAVVLFNLKRDPVPEFMLGNIMVFAALYFLLTLIIVPHFNDIGRIYRLSLGRDFSASKEQLQVLLLLLGAAFTTGLVKSFRRFQWN